ncbi:unnamed protein product, partial [Prorocentrum cordatum]
PWRVGGPNGADNWAKELRQRAWKNWPTPGGRPQQQVSAGASLSPKGIQTWAALPAGTYEKTKVALSISSRRKVDSARRAAAAGVLGAAGREAPQAVDKAARAVQTAKDKLASNKDNALKLLATIAEQEADMARLEEELANAKQEAAKLYGAKQRDQGIDGKKLRDFLGTLEVDGLSPGGVAQALPTAIANLEDTAQVAFPPRRIRAPRAARYLPRQRETNRGDISKGREHITSTLAAISKLIDSPDAGALQVISSHANAEADAPIESEMGEGSEEGPTAPAGGSSSSGAALPEGSQRSAPTPQPIPQLSEPERVPRARPAVCGRLRGGERATSCKAELVRIGWAARLAAGGATLTPSGVKEWSELPADIYEKTKNALSHSSRQKVEYARRAAASGLLGAAGREAPQAVDKAARALQNAKGRLASNKDKALRMLEAVATSEAEVAKLEKEFEAAKMDAAKLHGACTPAAGAFTAQQLKAKLGEIPTEGITLAEFLKSLQAAVDELDSASSKVEKDLGASTKLLVKELSKVKLKEPPTAGDWGAVAQPAAPPPSGSGSLDADGGGHDLRTYFGYRVCLRCFQHAKEVQGKHSGLGMACAPALKPSAQAANRAAARPAAQKLNGDGRIE